MTVVALELAAVVLLHIFICRLERATQYCGVLLLPASLLPEPCGLGALADCANSGRAFDPVSVRDKGRATSGPLCVLQHEGNGTGGHENHDLRLSVSARIGASTGRLA